MDTTTTSHALEYSTCLRHVVAVVYIGIPYRLVKYPGRRQGPSMSKFTWVIWLKGDEVSEAKRSEVGHTMHLLEKVRPHDIRSSYRYSLTTRGRFLVCMRSFPTTASNEVSNMPACGEDPHAIYVSVVQHQTGILTGMPS